MPTKVHANLSYETKSLNRFRNDLV